MLLEKAVAKAFGNYANLESGHSGFAMNLLTGAPSETVHIQDTPPQELFGIIQDSFNRHFLLNTSSAGDKEDLYKSHIEGF
jgi:hypothetical protein